MQSAMAAAFPAAIRSRRAEVCALVNTSCRLLLLALLLRRTAVVSECANAEALMHQLDSAIAGAMAVLLSAVPFSWAAISTYLNTAHAKRTGGASAMHQRSQIAKAGMEILC
jgi:putative Ca2+/H+ antiporter (TMEM165/GDT1 family)